MSLTIAVPDDIAEAVQDKSRQSGVPAEDMVLRVLRTMFAVPEELREEFRAWEHLSEEDAARLEEAEGLGWDAAG